MSIILRNYIKSILIEGSKFINFPSEDINAKNLSAEFNNKYGEQNKFNQQKMKSERGLHSFYDFLIDIASPNTFITFVDKYNKKTPGFSLNPFAEFNTPHGFYFYPFDKKNAVKFINYGSPTDSEFATDRKYFHLVKIDINHPNVFVIGPNGTENKPKLSSYEFDNKLTEICRIFLYYFSKNSNNKLINDFKDDIFLFLNNEKCKEILFNNILKINNSLLKKDGYFILYKIPNLLFSINLIKIKNEMGLNFKLIDSFQNDFINEPINLGINKKGNISIFYALVLNSIGMKCIVDKGTGTIHPNEPTQTHITTFSEDNSYFEYIGTYPNLSFFDTLGYKYTVKDWNENPNIWLSKFFAKGNQNLLLINNKKLGETDDFDYKNFFDNTFQLPNDSFHKMFALFDESQNKLIEDSYKTLKENMYKFKNIPLNDRFQFEFFEFMIQICYMVCNKSSTLYNNLESKSLNKILSKNVYEMSDIEMFECINYIKNNKNNNDIINKAQYIIKEVYMNKKKLCIINELKNNPIKNLDFFNDKELLCKVINNLKYFYIKRGFEDQNNEKYDFFSSNGYITLQDNFSKIFKYLISFYSLLDDNIKKDEEVKESILNLILDNDLYTTKEYETESNQILNLFKNAYTLNNKHIFDSAKEIYNLIENEFINSDIEEFFKSKLKIKKK